MFLTGLERILKKAGVQYTLQSGWRTRSLYSSGLTGVRAIFFHTTESAASAFNSGRDAPTLGYVTSGLGYPLYQALIGRSGRIYIVAAGAAAHAGTGIVSGIPRNSGNRYAFAISFDANGTTHPVTAAQLEAGARFAHALSSDWRSGLARWMHGEYAPGRRSDPTKVPGGWAALKAAVTRGRWSTASTPNPTPPTTPAPKPPTTPTPKPKDEDMPLNQKDRDDIRTIIRQESDRRNGQNVWHHELVASNEKQDWGVPAQVAGVRLRTAALRAGMTLAVAREIREIVRTIASKVGAPVKVDTKKLATELLGELYDPLTEALREAAGEAAVNVDADKLADSILSKTAEKLGK